MRAQYQHGSIISIKQRVTNIRNLPALDLRSGRQRRISTLPSQFTLAMFPSKTLPETLIFFLFALNISALLHSPTRLQFFSLAEDNFQKHTLLLDFKHNKPENTSKLFFSYLSIVQILFKAKEKVFGLMEGFFICSQKHTLIEILVRGSCPYSAQTQNHLTFIVENAMLQPVLDNMASTDDGVKWMCLPHFRANICWAWKRTM